MDRILQADLYRYNRLTGFRGFLKGMMIPGFRFTYFFRKASKFRKLSVRGLFYRIMLKHYSYKYGFQISPGTQIGEGFYIGHWGTLVISSSAKIGKNCNLSHCITIGKANRGKIEGYPTIGDNVWIGTNSVIVGKIQIGSNVLIAPCSFINFNVPDNSLVIGGQIKSRDNATEGYINNILNNDKSS